MSLVLIIATLAFRLLGAFGVRRFATWQVSAAHGLALFLVVTASAHFAPEGSAFTTNHADLVAMVPPFVPFPALMVYATGVLELLGAAGLVLAGTRRAAGLSLAVLFVLLLPANVYAALAGQDVSPLWLRVPEQILYIAVALWAALGARTVERAGDRVPA
ncbi:DoxX family protein [Nonomuraea sp. CA-218870]|uniref:DoxX family protein n=1 Tax=Nonomuraea sp. CA-218870 TaxID=3239998 RepID=UPI003D8E2823